MRCVAGTFKTPGSDLDLFFGIGFIPDWVKLYSMNANEQIALWSIHMARNATALEGWDIDDDGSITPNTYGVGIQPYFGGDVVTSTQATNGVCKVRDTLDYSKASNHDPVTYSDINKWTLTTGQTGYWNTPCNTTYVGVGSLIWIAQGNSAARRYIIAGLTSNGEQSGEVTLNVSGVNNGDIVKISNMYDYIGLAAGKVIPPGFWLDGTIDLINATSELAYFEAGTYDN